MLAPQSGLSVRTDNRAPSPTNRSHLRLVPRSVLPVHTDNRAYTAYGAALKAWRSGRREVLLAGPAGTGKSRLWLQKCHYAAMKYPGARILLCRKTRASMTQSVLVTFEKKVVPAGWLESNRLHWNQTDQQYEYPNGSIIAVGGLDKASKVMSSEWDLIYVPEATELLESDWGALVSRLRNGVMPYQQLGADCNPGAPTHWLKLRCDRGETLMLHSRHQDNPMIKPAYLAGLRALPRLLKLRLYDGVWAAAEGMVYEEEWNPAIHLIDRFDIPPSWPRYWAIDWGFKNPFVWQAWAQSPDGILYRYWEIYQTERLVEDMARKVMQITAGEPRPRAVICDHDAEDRKTFEKHTGLETIGARKAVSLGIQTQKARLRIGGNNKAGMYYLRDSLVEIDQKLADKYLPLCSEQEYEHYVWDVSNGRRQGEEPVKKFDHGCLVAGTLVTTDRGDIPIERIRPGDQVLTRFGYRRVKAAGMTQQNAEVYTMHCSDGKYLTGTADHPIYGCTKGYTPLRKMRYSDKIMTVEQMLRRLSLWEEETWVSRSPSSTKALSSGAIQNRLYGARGTTIAPTPRIEKQVSCVSTRKYGEMPMALSRKALRSITGMETHSITRLKILSACHMKTIRNGMSFMKNRLAASFSESTLLQKCGKQPKRGMALRRAKHGIKNLGVWPGMMQSIAPLPVNIVVPLSSRERSSRAMLAFAQRTAKPTLGVTQALTILWSRVSSVAKSFNAINIVRSGFVRGNVQSSIIFQKQPGRRAFAAFAENRLLSTAPINEKAAQQSAGNVTVIEVRKSKELVPVYNLTVDAPVGEYFANGILVHNCDTTRYLCMYIDDPVDHDIHALDPDVAAALSAYRGY